MKIERVMSEYDEDLYRGRNLHEIDAIMFHRIDEGEDAAAVAAWFREHPEVLGTPAMPYLFIIPRDGRIQQTAPLTAVTPHGWKWNKRAIGVGVVGDFRSKVKRPPTSAQFDACAWLTRRLFDYFRRPLQVVGHSQVPGGTKWGGAHDCPGGLFPMKDIVAAARDRGEFV